MGLQFLAEGLENKYMVSPFTASVLGASPGEIHHGSIIIAIIWEVLMGIGYQLSRS